MSGTDAVYVLIRRTGQYEVDESPVAAFLTEAEAESARDKAGQELDAATEAHPAPECPEGGVSDEEWEAWEQKSEANWLAFRAALTVDPRAAPEGSWATLDDIEYCVWRVPFAGETP